MNQECPPTQDKISINYLTTSNEKAKLVLWTILITKNINTYEEKYKREELNVIADF